MKKNILLLITSLLLIGCPSDEDLGSKSLCIDNQSGQEMYFWFSHDFSNHHYPDTSLPSELPYSIRGAGSGGCVGSNVGKSPSWETVFSQLPEDKFSVYFFESYPETQEQWDEIRNNPEMVYRKDITLDELINNDYTIEYP